MVSEEILGGMLGGGLVGALVGLGLIFLVLFAGLYIYSALALMALAKKTKTKNEWLAWIPVANFYLTTQMAKQSGWWTLILLLSFVPFGGFAIMIVSIWLFWVIAERIGMPAWTSLLMIIPLVNLIVLGIYAWSK